MIEDKQGTCEVQRLTTEEYRARRTNQIKQEKYKELFDALKLCMEHQFFYGAIFIEYGIIEDRLASVSKSANRKYLKSNGNHINIWELWENAKAIETDYSSILPEKYRGAFHNMDDIFEKWRNNRNTMEHRLADEPLGDAKVEEVALEGQNLANIIRDICGHLEYYLNTRGITKYES